MAEVVKAYVSVNLLLAIAAGLLTWGFLQAEGFHLAVPLAVLVAFLDLIPLIGLTVGGFAVFAVLMIDGGPGDAIVWLILFLIYQQAPGPRHSAALYKGGALKVNPAVAIVAVIVGAEPRRRARGAARDSHCGFAGGCDRRAGFLRAPRRRTGRSLSRAD